MKTKLTMWAVITTALLFSAGKSLAQVDLVPGINYAYNPPGANGIVTGITVDACNNGGGSSSAFDVAIYLYDSNNGNHWNIGTTRVNNGLSGNACITISNWDIDINSTAGIPAGTYRIGTWVDSGSEETESNENNNTGLMNGNINYTPSPNATKELSENIEFLSTYPNPSSGITRVSFSITQKGNVAVSIYDVTGKELSSIVDENLAGGTHTFLFDTKDLKDGVYFVNFVTQQTSMTQRLIVTNANY
jgi:hypothetical protein